MNDEAHTSESRKLPSPADPVASRGLAPRLVASERGFGIVSPERQFGTALLIVGGSAGIPSSVSILNRNPHQRASAIRVSWCEQ